MHERTGAVQACGRPDRGEKAAFWQGHLEAWRRAGGSVRGYCRRHGLSEPSFYAWRRQLDQRVAVGAVSGSKPPTFVPVAVVKDRQAPVTASRVELEATGFEIVLPGGAVMRVTPGVDRALSAEALVALAKLSGSEVAGC